MVWPILSSKLASCAVRFCRVRLYSGIHRRPAASTASLRRRTKANVDFLAPLLGGSGGILGGYDRVKARLDQFQLRPTCGGILFFWCPGMERLLLVQPRPTYAEGVEASLTSC